MKAYNFDPVETVRYKDAAGIEHLKIIYEGINWMEGIPINVTMDQNFMNLVISRIVQIMDSIYDEGDKDERDNKNDDTTTS